MNLDWICMKTRRRMLLRQLSSSPASQRRRFRSSSRMENWRFLLRPRSVKIRPTPDTPYANAFTANSHVPFGYLKVYRYVALLQISFDEHLPWLTSIVEQSEQIKARLENGLLTVTFPKTLPEVAPRKIVIQTLADKEGYDTDFNLWISFFPIRNFTTCRFKLLFNILFS